MMYVCGYACALMYAWRSEVSFVASLGLAVGSPGHKACAESVSRLSHPASQLSVSHFHSCS